MPQDAAEQRVRERQPTGHADLGAVHDDGVGHGQASADAPERKGGIEDGERRSGLGRQRVDAYAKGARREQHRLARALDAKGLDGVEGGGPLVRGRQHREPVGR